MTGASAEGMVMLAIEALDGSLWSALAHVVGQAAARRVRPELPAAFDSPDVCTAALQRLCDSGQHGLVGDGQNGVLPRSWPRTARENPAVADALLLAEGFAVDPDLTDPTGVLAAAFADLAAPLIAGGVRRYYLLHTALPRRLEALSNLGFGRRSAYGIQPERRGAALPPSPCGSPGPETWRPSPAWPWLNSSTAPRRRCSHPARTGPSPIWPPSTAPCARPAWSTRDPSLTARTWR